MLNQTVSAKAYLAVHPGKPLDCHHSRLKVNLVGELSQEGAKRCAIPCLELERYARFGK